MICVFYFRSKIKKSLLSICFILHCKCGLRHLFDQRCFAGFSFHNDGWILLLRSDLVHWLCPIFLKIYDSFLEIVFYLLQRLKGVDEQLSCLKYYIRYVWIYISWWVKWHSIYSLELSFDLHVIRYCLIKLQLIYRYR